MKILDLIIKLTEMAKESPGADVYIDATIDSGDSYYGKQRYDDLQPDVIGLNSDGKSIYIEVEN